MNLQEREYSHTELRMIASVFYDAERRRNPTIFAGIQPLMGPSFEDLAASVQEDIISALKRRIDNETLLGYLARKKREVGATTIEPVENELKERGLL